jgi:hypothetical protein
MRMMLLITLAFTFLQIQKMLKIRRARALRGCSAIIFASNVPMILANEIEK